MDVEVCRIRNRRLYIQSCLRSTSMTFLEFRKIQHLNCLVLTTNDSSKVTAHTSSTYPEMEKILIGDTICGCIYTDYRSRFRTIRLVTIDSNVHCQSIHCITQLDSEVTEVNAKDIERYIILNLIGKLESLSDLEQPN